MAKYSIVQLKSSIGLRKEIKENLKSLGLKKINSKVEVPQNVFTDGLLKKVAHLVKFEVIK